LESPDSLFADRDFFVMRRYRAPYAKIEQEIKVAPATMIFTVILPLSGLLFHDNLPH